MKLIEYEVPKCEEDWKFQTLSEKERLIYWEYRVDLRMKMLYVTEGQKGQCVLRKLQQNE